MDTFYYIAAYNRLEIEELRTVASKQKRGIVTNLNFEPEDIVVNDVRLQSSYD